VKQLHGGPGVVGGPLIAPLHQRDHDRIQIPALVCQLVFVSASAALVGVGHPLQKSMRHKSFQSCSEKVARAAQCGVEIVEPSHPVERLTQDEQRPLLADHTERASDRAVGRAVAEPI
jgi:hypothetical protein